MEETTLAAGFRPRTRPQFASRKNRQCRHPCFLGQYVPRSLDRQTPDVVYFGSRRQLATPSSIMPEHENVSEIAGTFDRFELHRYLWTTAE